MAAKRKFKNKILPRGIVEERGYFFIRISHQGKRFLECYGPATSTVVLSEAIAKLNRYREDIRLGKFGLEKKARRLTIEKACDVFWDLHASKKRSYPAFRIYLNHIKTYFAGRFIDTLTYIDVENYRREREKAVMPSTVNKEHACLTTLFFKLKEWKRRKIIESVQLPEDNPGTGVRKVDEKQFQRTRVLSQEEFNRVMQCSTISLRRILLGGVLTTLRNIDLKELTKDNINLATNELEGTQRKTGKPFRIPIAGQIGELIASANGHHIFDFTNFRKNFDIARARSGVRDFQFKDLRRTGATMMERKGIALSAVSSYLGHSSLRMTEVYVRPSREDKQLGGEILGSMFKWPQAPERTQMAVKMAVTAER